MKLQYVENIASETATATLLLHGEIGFNNQNWSGIDGAAFARELYFLQDYLGVQKCIISINSPGGSVMDGYSIFSAITNINKIGKMQIETRNDGVAASIAGVVYLAGKKMYMQDYAHFMLHNPSGGGNTTKDIEVLQNFKESLITIIAGRTGKSREDISDMMDVETWMLADEAKENGFVDEIITNSKKPKMPAANKENAAQAYAIVNSFLSTTKKEEPAPRNITINIDSLLKDGNIPIPKDMDTESIKAAVERVLLGVVKNVVSLEALEPPTQPKQAKNQPNYRMTNNKLKTSEEYKNMEPSEAIDSLLAVITDLTNKQKESDTTLNTQKTALETLESEKKELLKTQAEVLVENAITVGKLKAKQGAKPEEFKDKWVNLAIADFKNTAAIIAEMPTTVKSVNVNNMIEKTEETGAHPMGLTAEEAKYNHRDWEKINPTRLLQLKRENPEWGQELLNKTYQR